jgi:hypothetical protein
MIWLLERAGERLQYEIRPAVDGDGYQLVWTQNGQSRVEHFSNPDDAAARRHEIENKLKLDGWSRVGRETPHPDGKRFV